MRIPASTYRLQLNADFPLSRVREHIDYFCQLGVGDLYFSPILEARAHSPHGYDVTHPGRLNPLIAAEGELEEISHALHGHGMGIIMDIVPNHMAASVENPWWRDILIHGPASLAARFFDVQWHAGDGGLRIVLPLLGRPLAEALAAGELSLAFREGFEIVYFEHSFPVDPGTYGQLLAGIDGMDPALIRDAHRISPRSVTSVEERERRRDDARALQQGLEEWLLDGHNAERLTHHIARFTPDQLRALLDAQAYTLEFWRTGVRRINYRRFFDVADLAAIRVEDPDIFAVTHALILDLIRTGRVHGLRIDHVDGLLDPAKYLRDLRAAAGDAYIVVEKVLAPKEELPEGWPVEGTTGYDFIGWLAGLYCDPDGAALITERYERRTGLPPFADVVYEKKKLVIDMLFAAELDALSSELLSIAQLAGITTDRATIAACITEVTAALHVYRTYLHGAVSAYDRCVIKHAVNAARHRAPHIPDPVHALLRSVLLDEELPPEAASRRTPFIADWQQFTGPVMAKGSEDTALYVYHGLLALSDVGVQPGATIASAREVHEIMARRGQKWPYSMNASSTHDTKRSEDVRARIQTLSEMPDAWESALDRWTEISRKYRQVLDGRDCPDTNEQILIYQTLLGIWPLVPSETASLPARLGTFLRKALREAKQHSSWLDPDEKYEEAIVDFACALLRDVEFVDDLQTLARDVAWLGALNSLSQLVLKLAAPGVPDFYQGNESWSFRLVDPDNRAPVDFNALSEQLASLPHEMTPAHASGLLHDWKDGRIKLHVSRSGLQLRKSRSRLFLNGDYIPISARGRFADNVIAFARRYRDEWALVAAGRYYSQVGPRPLATAWGDTTLELPPDAPRAWRNVLTDEVTNGSALEALFATLPFAIVLGADA